MMCASHGYSVGREELAEGDRRWLICRTSSGLPHLIRPMLASLRHELPEGENRYGWELKWDELRAIAYVSEGKVRLVSRNDKDMAAS